MVILDSTSGSTNTTYTYTGVGHTANSISFANDASGNATIVINGHSITIKPGEVFDASFPVSFTQVGITVSGAYRMLIGK